MMSKNGKIIVLCILRKMPVELQAHFFETRSPSRKNPFNLRFSAMPLKSKSMEPSAFEMEKLIFPALRFRISPKT
jgi:hypothetical protein